MARIVMKFGGTSVADIDLQNDDLGCRPETLIRTGFVAFPGSVAFSWIRVLIREILFSRRNTPERA